MANYYFAKGPEAWQREKKRKREVAAHFREQMRRYGSKHCNHCGTELVEFAHYCGFCEIELGLAPAR